MIGNAIFCTRIFKWLVKSGQSGFTKLIGQILMAVKAIWWNRRIEKERPEDHFSFHIWYQC